MKHFPLIFLFFTFNSHAFGEEIKCPANAHYVDCLSNCPLTCANRKQMALAGACIEVCKSAGCQCNPGFMLDNLGNCVTENECPKCETKCVENAHYTECLDNCPLTCANRLEEPVACVQACLAAGCQCDTGFLMDDFGNCVTENECPKTLICDDNETLNTCGNGCGIKNEQTCESLSQNGTPIRVNSTGVVCPAVCRKLCECSKGFYRRKDGKCVAPGECKHS